MLKTHSMTSQVYLCINNIYAYVFIYNNILYLKILFWHKTIMKILIISYKYD